MAGYEETLNKIRELADQYQESGQNELWSDAETDYANYEAWHNAGEKDACPVDTAKYTGETAPLVTAPTSEPVEYKAVDFETVEETNVPRQEKRDEARIQRLITDSVQSMARENYDQAEKLIKEALDLDPSDQVAQDTLKHIQASRSENARKSLIYTLKFGKDIGPLNTALDAAKNELIKNPNDDEIAQLWDAAKDRFDEIRRTQGQFTTAEAAEEYFTVINGIAAMENARDSGSTTWNDERLKQIRPIEDVLSDYTASVGRLVKDLVNKKMAHVDAYLPPVGAKNPVSALQTLQESLELKGIEDGTRKQIESRIKIVSEEKNQWEKADAELKKAENPQLNDLERFKHFLAAKGVYPQHSDVLDHEQNYALNAALYLTEILENSLSKNENLLEHESKAAVDQRVSGHADKPLPLFEESRKEIQGILIDANRIPEEHTTGRLKKAKEKANSFLKTLEKAENYRKEIRSIYLQITNEARKNPQTAIDTLEDLESEILEDPEIKYLRRALALDLNADEHIKIARKHFESGKYRDCQDELNQIRDPGVLEAEINQLLENADLRLNQEIILDFWGKKFFDDAYEKIKRILRDRYINTDLANEIIQETKLNEKMAECQSRFEVDESNKILEQVAALRKEWDQIQEGSLNEHTLFDWVERAISLLQGVQNIARLPSSKEGKWIIWASEIKTVIHNKAFAILSTNSDTEKREEITARFRIVQRLHQYLLVETQDDRTCRRNICLAYFSSTQKELERSENWAEIVRIWEAAYLEFGDPAFWDKLHISRFEAVKHVTMNALRKFDYEKAIAMANQNELPFTFDPQSPTPFTHEEERELGKLAQQGELMRVAYGLYEQKDYITMSETLLAGIKDNEPKVLVDYKHELVNKAINFLAEKGDAIVKENFAEGVMCFSIILRLDPENPLARGRIDDYEDNVYAEIKRLRTERDELDPVADIDLQLKQNHDRGLSLQSLKASLDFLDNRNTPDKKFLKMASEENAQLRTILENAKKIINDLSDEGAVWQGILQRGDWTRAKNKIDELALIIGSHPMVRTLETRLKSASETSRHRADIRKLLEDAYLGDRFDDFITNYQALITELSRESSGHEIPVDRYWIFPEDHMFFDDFLKKDVPFFHTQGEEHCVECIVNQRIPNYKQFEKYADKVEEATKLIKSDFEQLQGTSENYAALQKCKNFVNLCEKTWAELIGPADDPASKSAKGLQDKAEEEISIYQKDQEIIIKRILMLDEKHREYQAELAKIITLVNMHDFYKAQQKLLPIRDFYIEGENEFRQMIEHIFSICSR